MASRRRHEDRVSEVLTHLIAPGVSIESETAVPARHFRTDFLLRIDAPTAAWGPLRDAVGQRELIVEAWADTMPLRGLLTSRIKLLGRCDRAWPSPRRALPWRTDEEEGPGRAPLMLLIARQAPQVLTAEKEFRPWGEATGIHRHLLGPFGCIILVETARLEAQPGTSLLRLLSLPRSLDEFRHHLALVDDDHTLPEELRKQVLEAIVTKQITTTEDEYRSAWDRAIQTGEARGEKRGEKRGRRQALLDVAGTVAPDALPRLKKIRDIDALHRAVHDLLSGLRSG